MFQRFKRHLQCRNQRSIGINLCNRLKQLQKKDLLVGKFYKRIKQTAAYKTAKLSKASLLKQKVCILCDNGEEINMRCKMFVKKSDCLTEMSTSIQLSQTLQILADIKSWVQVKVYGDVSVVLTGIDQTIGAGARYRR
jgi:hypothetical protein